MVCPGIPEDHGRYFLAIHLRAEKKFDVKVPEPGMENEVPDDLSAFQNPPMTKEERRGIIWLSLKASLTVGLIFGSAAIFVYFILCIRVAEIKERLSEKKFILTYVILFRNNRILSAELKSFLKFRLKNSGRQLILSAVKLCRLSLS